MRIPARLLLATTLVLACQRKPPPPPPPAEPTKDVAVAKPAATKDAPVVPVYRTQESNDHIDPQLLGHGKSFMVVSEAPLASKVGSDILAAGGNAVDAAVATAFALAVVYPTAGNLGGGGFAVVRVAAGKAVALDFRETAPGAATTNMYLDDKGEVTKASLVGYKASGVPGSVAGLWTLHQKLGKKPWKELVEPAITLARDGFAVDKLLASKIERRAKMLLEFPASAELWVPNRIPRAEGAIVAIPLLAVALERIRDQGADGFYKGETAAAIAKDMKANGGLITLEDLAGYKAEWRDPLRIAYRGHSVVSMPPPSSGGIVIGMTAGILRNFDVSKFAWHGYDHVHYLVETWRRAFAARNELLGDPAFVKDMPITRLLAQPYLDKLATSITPTATKSADIPPIVDGDHTTNLCVVDSTGMAVALTTTLNTGWGSGVTIHGFLMNNEMDDFSAKPGSANVFGLVQGVANKIEPGKRMLSSMSPTIVEDMKGDLRIVVGGAGGPRIITEVWQTISNVIDFGLTAGAAVARPRVHHQHLPDNIAIEPDSIDTDTDAKLRAAGYELRHSNSPPEFGTANAIVRVKDGWDGAADPRGGGAAIGD